ncbi:MAG: hypothetical protein M3P51_15550, partial [Chloroflexota bacterium]|nr:hypothetical protein [Chloroflexota bacterium]
MNADNYVSVLAVETPKQFGFSATTREEAEQWQREFRPELVRLLGLEAIASRGEPPMWANLLSRIELPDHVREDWTLETEAGFELPYYLLRPLNADRPLPLVLTPHGHNKQGRRTYAGVWTSEEEQAQAEQGERDVA